jgi:hypothetical protein
MWYIRAPGLTLVSGSESVAQEKCMNKIAVLVVCVSVVAVSWQACFGAEAEDLVSPSGVNFGCKLAAAPADLVGAQIPHNDSISPTTATTGVAAPVGLTSPDLNCSQVSLKAEVRFDHLVADTSSEEAMAPQKTDTSETGIARVR